MLIEKRVGGLLVFRDRLKTSSPPFATDDLLPSFFVFYYYENSKPTPSSPPARPSLTLSQTWSILVRFPPPVTARLFPCLLVAGVLGALGTLADSAKQAEDSVEDSVDDATQAGENVFDTAEQGGEAAVDEGDGPADGAVQQSLEAVELDAADGLLQEVLAGVGASLHAGEAEEAACLGGVGDEEVVERLLDCGESGGCHCADDSGDGSGGATNDSTYDSTYGPDNTVDNSLDTEDKVAKGGRARGRTRCLSRYQNRISR